MKKQLIIFYTIQATIVISMIFLAIHIGQNDPELIRNQFTEECNTHWIEEMKRNGCFGMYEDSWTSKLAEYNWTPNE